MTRGMKAYILAGGLTLGFHALGGSLGWWKGGPFIEAMSVKNWNTGGGGGGSGWGGGGFRGGK